MDVPGGYAAGEVEHVDGPGNRALRQVDDDGGVAEGAGVDTRRGSSCPPFSVAVRVYVWAEAGTAVNPMVTSAASSGVIQRVFMGHLLRKAFKTGE